MSIHYAEVYNAARQMTLGEAFEIAVTSRSLHNTNGTVQMCAALQVLGDGIYDLMDDANRVPYFARQGAYLWIRDAIEDRDPTIPALLADPWSAETHSELWKDDYGSRYRGNATGPEVRAWLKERRNRDRNESLRDHAEDLAGDHYG